MALTIGRMWKLSVGAIATVPPAASTAAATIGPTAAILVLGEAVGKRCQVVARTGDRLEAA